MQFILKEMKCSKRDMVQLKITALHSQIVNFASKSSHVNVIIHFSFIINRRYIVQSGGCACFLHANFG